MNTRLFFSSLALGFFACTNQTSDQQNLDMSLQYPETRTVDSTDDYHGTSIADPYRWLENDTAESVEAWVKAQNTVTFDYLVGVYEGLR